MTAARSLEVDSNAAFLATSARDRSEINRLREELRALRESLRIAIVQQESTNRELHSANDEVQSANEELQSINEELETSREQLQASNDQLLEVNDALLQRSMEVAAANMELSAMLGATAIAVAIVDADLRIRRTSAAAAAALGLRPEDIGRRLPEVALRLSCPDLEARLENVIETGVGMELDAQHDTGGPVSVRLAPFLTDQNRIDGAVIVATSAGAAREAKIPAQRTRAD